MKKGKLLLLLMVATHVLHAQELKLDDGITICHTTPTEKFALFAQDDSFNMSHPIRSLTST